MTTLILNPCPCGWAGDPSGRCRCSPDAIRRYRGRVSGPLLDRIDLHVEVARLPPAALRPDAPAGESTQTVRARIVEARARQHARSGKTNAVLDQPETASACRLADADRLLLERAVDALQLSARSMHRIMRVARTIADLDGAEVIGTAHLTEAISLRRATRGLEAAVA